MALLIDIRAPDWMSDEALHELLAPHLPGVTIHLGPPERALPDVVMLATNQLKPGMTKGLANLQLVQKLGAGVETMLGSDDLPPAVRIARLEPMVQADEIAEYCLSMVLAGLRDIYPYRASQEQAVWTPRQPRRLADTSVTVLGLGHIGHHVAVMMAGLGCQVTGWSRSPKEIDGITCLAGAGALPEALGGADFVISVLPSTPETHGMMGARAFAMMQPHAVLINVGRGDLVDERALIDALDRGELGGAMLDVLSQEPLPSDSPLWGHPKVVITPHVSGWSLDDGLVDVAENYKRLVAGQPLLREIDRARGY